MTGDAVDHDQARDAVAALVTSHKGEFILRMGSRPPHSLIFTGESSAGSTVYGLPRTDAELHRLSSEISRVMEELGGKVCNVSCYETFD